MDGWKGEAQGAGGAEQLLESEARKLLLYAPKQVTSQVLLGVGSIWEGQRVIGVSCPEDTKD